MKGYTYDSKEDAWVKESDNGMKIVITFTGTEEEHEEAMNHLLEYLMSTIG